MTYKRSALEAGPLRSPDQPTRRAQAFYEHDLFDASSVRPKSTFPAGLPPLFPPPRTLRPCRQWVSALVRFSLSAPSRDIQCTVPPPRLTLSVYLIFSVNLIFSYLLPTQTFGEPAPIHRYRWLCLPPAVEPSMAQTAQGGLADAGPRQPTKPQSPQWPGTHPLSRGMHIVAAARAAPPPPPPRRRPVLALRAGGPRPSGGVEVAGLVGAVRGAVRWLGRR
jgi:hypothetical protein